MTEIRWVDRPGDVRLPYVVLGSSDGPRLLFAPSLLAAAVEGSAIFEPVVAAGWTVLVPDHRGHGLAEGSWASDDFRLDVLGDDLLAILDHVGWETAWIGGGSMGVATSMAAMVKEPERAEGMVFMAPAIGAEINPALDRFRPIGDAFDEDVEAGIAAWQARANGDDVINPKHETALRRLGPGGAAALMRAIPGWHFGALPRFDCTVVTSAWENDPVHPKATALAIAGASPRGVFHPIDLRADPNFFAHLARQLAPYGDQQRAAAARE